MNTHEKKRAHENCTCPAVPGSDYCSPACQASRETADAACGCGHSECAGAQAAA